MSKIEVLKQDSHESSAENLETKKTYEQLTKKQESAHERMRKSSERDQSHQKHEAERVIAELAKSKKELADKKPKTESDTFDLRKSQADKEYSFKATMHSVRQNMSAPEKQFSKFIHRPVVEKVSDVAGKTIARPSGVTGAVIAAFVGLLLIYGVAKFAGFTLSGSEMPLLLAMGFTLGILAEWIFKSIRSIFSPGSS